MKEKTITVRLTVAELKAATQALSNEYAHRVRQNAAAGKAAQDDYTNRLCDASDKMYSALTDALNKSSKRRREER